MRILVTICCMLIATSMYGKHYSHGEHLTDKIFDRVVVKELKPKFHYSVCGYGGSSSRDYVRLISADFDCQRYLSQDEISDILIETAEIVLRAYNSNKKIRPLLVEYPLTLENLEFTVKGLDPNEKHPEAVSWAFLLSRPPFRLVYYYWDPIKRRIDRSTPPEERESYAVVKARREAARGRPFLED